MAPVRAAQEPSCAPVSPVPATIDHVIDGDTVVFEGGARVRLVGIDTPELGQDGRPDDPGAAAARDWLALRLRAGTPVLAAADAENRDRHGRLLRHLFLADGTNLQAALLEEGLATPLVMPPSVAFLSCYHRAADRAMTRGHGLWGRAEYRPGKAAALSPDTRGYRVVEARVLRVHRRHGAAWLDVDGPLSISIPAASLPLFDADALDALAGTTAVFRGMVYPRGRRLRLYLRHPLDLLDGAAPGNPLPTTESK